MYLYGYNRTWLDNLFKKSTIHRNKRVLYYEEMIPYVDHLEDKRVSKCALFR